MTWQDEGSFNGPDEGGLLGENTEYGVQNDRAVAREQIRIDAARGQPFDPDAGPDSGYLPSTVVGRSVPQPGTQASDARDPDGT